MTGEVSESGVSPGHFFPYIDHSPFLLQGNIMEPEEWDLILTIKNKRMGNAAGPTRIRLSVAQTLH